MQRITSAILTEIRELKAANEHGAAYALAANALGCTDIADRISAINQRQLRLGHLPLSLYQQRHQLYQALLAKAKTLLSESDYQRLYLSF